MDKHQLKATIWALKFDIKCLKCLPDSNPQKEKSIETLRASIEALEEQLNGTKTDNPYQAG